MAYVIAEPCIDVKDTACCSPRGGPGGGPGGLCGGSSSPSWLLCCRSSFCWFEDRCGGSREPGSCS